MGERRKTPLNAPLAEASRYAWKDAATLNFRSASREEISSSLPRYHLERSMQLNHIDPGGTKKGWHSALNKRNSLLPRNMKRSLRNG